jgi:exonuclease VII large subunit
MNPSKTPRFTIRINPELHEWFKAYASRMNTSMSELVIEYIGKLRHPKAVLSDTPYEHKHRTYEQEIERADCKLTHDIELAEEKTGEIHHLRAELAEKNRQIETLLQQLSHSQQLLAMQTKNNAALTEQLDTSRQMIEDMRRRKIPLLRRIFRWT